MSQAELIEARQLANQFEWAINTLVTTDNKVGDKDVKAIHGKSLARAITKAIRDNMDYKGVRNKMTLLFGDHRPMMAFASLSKLASRRHPTFYTLPNGGASFIFELFSYPENTTNSTGATEKYPKSNFLNVRFYMRNDTSSSEANFKAYPLFENSPSKISMPLPEFLQSMDGISVQPAEWCELCDSKKAWCASATAKGEGSASRIGHEDDYQKYDDDEYNPWACGDKAAHAIRMTSFRMGVAVVVIPVMLVLTVLLWLLAGHILRDEIKHWWVTRSKWSPKRLFRRRGGTQNTPTTPHPDVSRAHVDGGNTRQTRSDDIELQTSYPPLDHINPSCASPTPSSAAPTLANPFASKPPSFV
ncbi:hypothetical protein KEM54_006149 [Ascosphaera aggregata]|nr:hypothetical protein KEM54_006149 [Ascosphaera aggregata]